MPDWKPEIRARLATVSLAPAREAEIVEELSQHLEDRWHELVAGGSAPDEATRLALAEFGQRNAFARYMAPLRQAHWADPTPPPPRGWFLFGGLRIDIRDAVRALRGAPGFTTVTLLVLTLGIGTTTAIFSVVDAVVLRGLPFEDPDRLVAVGERGSGGKGGGGMPAGFPRPRGVDPADPQAINRAKPQDYMDWVVRQHVFESLAALAGNDFTLYLPGAAPEDIVGQRVTASAFDVFRVRAARGRVFTADNEVDGRHRVVLLGDAFWRRRFEARADVVGRTIGLDDGQYEVIGVLPAGAVYPPGALKPTDVWVPYVLQESERERGRTVGQYLQCVARLKLGVTLARAQAEMDQIGAALEQAYPDWNRGTRFGVRPLRDHVVGASTKSWMLMLLSAVGIVLLIACANVANLLLARASVRERDVAIRAALGAGRWRLVRQLIVESLLLSTAGTILAVVLAVWAVQILKQAMPDGVARVAAIAIDLRVLGAAAALSLATGLLFGVVPAWQCSKPQLTSSLKEATLGGGSSRGRRRLRSALVVAEVALAVLLLVGAALFIGSFIRLMRVDPGFDAERVLTAQVYQQRLPGQSTPNLSPSFAQIVERLGQRPGVVRAAAVYPGVPLRQSMWINGLMPAGSTVTRQQAVSIKIVTPDYHQALQIPLRGGRLFNADDRDGGAPVIILSESAARACFPGQDAVGRSARIENRDRAIVGVVGDVRQWGLESDSRPEAYLPMTQMPVSSAYVVVRTGVDPYALLSDVRKAVLDATPTIPLRFVATMGELMAGQTAQRRLNMLMLGLFGLLGLVISAVGVYGVMAYVVSQRTREIGVRIALGARPSQVIGMILGSASALVAAGLVIGGATSWYLAANANKFLFGLEGRDARAFVVAMAAIVVAALPASLIPARRAASVDPTVALRAE